MKPRLQLRVARSQKEQQKMLSNQECLRHVACVRLLLRSKTSKTRSLCFKLLSRKLVTNAISYRNFIVSSILLKCIGVGQRFVSFLFNGALICCLNPAGLRMSSDGTFPTAKRLVPEILDACLITTIRAFFRKTWRYMDAYRWAFVWHRKAQRILKYLQ